MTTEAPLADAPAARLSPAQAREEFPVLSDYCYLDVASRAPMSNRVRAALDRYCTTYQTEPLPKQRWLEEVERVRARAARLMGARPTEVAFTKSTSDSLNQLAHALGLQAGDNVIVAPELEHGNNVYPWLHLRDVGVEVRTVALQDNQFPVEQAIALVDGRTRVISLASVSFANGARADLAEIARLCEERGVFLLVDAVQELGAMRMNVRELGIHGLGAATQKMLLSMYGFGLLYCREDWLPRMRPPFLTRMGVEWGDGHESDLDMDYRISASAARFEVGNPNFAGVFALDAALSLIEDVGPETVESHILSLARRLLDGLDRIGVEVLTPRADGAHAGIVSFRHPDTEGLATALARERVTVALRRGSIRASVHVFNADEDVDHLLDVVDRFGRS